jgi:two-component system, OmpR family, response regulator
MIRDDEPDRLEILMKFRAYIVEDSPTIRENLIETLQELALVDAVGTAETENEGKQWLAQHDDYWDLAIVDLFLKEGSGLNILEACRERRPGQKMVVLSNHATSDVRWRCAQLGADAVFDKSTEIDDLVEYCVNERVKADPP